MPGFKIEVNHPVFENQPDLYILVSLAVSDTHWLTSMFAKTAFCQILDCFWLRYELAA